jgi:hypothetical protein
MIKERDFIEVYEGCLDPKYCDEVIKAFERADQVGLVIPRKEIQRTIDKQQEMNPIFTPMPENNINQELWPQIDMRQETICKLFFSVLNEKLKEYQATYHQDHVHWTYRNMLVQKSSYKDFGGYHQFHAECDSMESSDRWLVYAAYLNDVPEGEGETQFLFQRRKITPKKGDIAIWPAGFTHTHRGNPMLTGDKYIATGWVFYNG